MKNLKIITLIIVGLSQISLISAMGDIYREEPRMILENGSYLPQENIGLNKKCKKEIETFLVSDLADIVTGYADYENDIIQNNRLYEAMVDRNITAMMEAIEKGAKVNLTTLLNGNTPLICITQGIYIHTLEKLNFVKYLINKGADINIQNIDGDMALILAIKEYYLLIDTHKGIDGSNIPIVLELINVILKNKVNVNIQNKHGETALMIAAYSGNDELVKNLINHGADKNIKDINDKTAYDYAKKSEIKEILYPKALCEQEERLKREKELKKAKQSEFDKKFSALTQKQVKQQHLQRQEELQRYEEQQRLTDQRAREALAQVATQASNESEENWGLEPEEAEGWGEMEQGD